MGKKLWGGEVIGEDTPGLQRSRINKQKVKFRKGDVTWSGGGLLYFILVDLTKSFKSFIQYDN